MSHLRGGLVKGWLLAVAGLSCTRSRPRMEVRRLGYIIIMTVTTSFTMCHLLKNSSFSWPPTLPGPPTCCWLLAGDCGRPRPTGTRALLGAVGVKLGSWPLKLWSWPRKLWSWPLKLCWTCP